jgi:hypothetical protein
MQSKRPLLQDGSHEFFQLMGVEAVDEVWTLPHRASFSFATTSRASRKKGWPALGPLPSPTTLVGGPKRLMSCVCREAIDVQSYVGEDL